MVNIYLRRALRLGAIFGLVALSVSAIGMVEAFNERYIITGVVTLGQILLFSAPLLAGYFATRAGIDETAPSAGTLLGTGLLAGVVSALPLVGLVLLATVWTNIRSVLVNVSPALIDTLTFGQGPVVGSVILIVVMAVLGATAALVHAAPERYRRPVLIGLGVTALAGMGSEIFLNILRNELFRTFVPREVLSFLLGSTGLQPWTAAAVFVAAAGLAFWWRERGEQRFATRRAQMSPEQEARQRRALLIGGVFLLLALPWILGLYLTEVIDIVGVFALMGLGLNIVVGFAGLLDLGYVAFFAIGAYTMGLLTTTSDLGVGGFPFWVALPFAIAASTLAGILLGIPVLRMRGDYLAIVTLGFGEIIRVLVVSDLLKPVIGGAQGILQIGKPEILSFVFTEPRHFYYIILVACVLAMFVSARLRDARPGRRWVALREDEDVAEAMGINLVATKLLAFAIGAAFAGLAGAIFASRIGSIFPHSFGLLISINVLSLIIVGGIGSLPGVIVGAIVLVGLPELLREFAEYRLLMYGALLITMMVLRPEGLWPSAARRRELHAEEDIAVREEPAVHPAEVKPLT